MRFSILLGLAALLWPGVTLLVVAILFGLELIAAGLVRVVAAATLSGLPAWWRAMSGVLGVLTVLAVSVFAGRGQRSVDAADSAPAHWQPGPHPRP